MITITLTGHEAEQYIKSRGAVVKQLIPKPLPKPLPKIPQPEQPDQSGNKNPLDAEWKKLVITGNPLSERRVRRRWNKTEINILLNAVNKPNPTFYSIEVLAKILNRTYSSVRSEAIRRGINTKKGMLTK